MGLLCPPGRKKQGEVLGTKVSFTVETYMDVLRCGQYGTTRVQLGINPYCTLRWQLLPEGFCTRKVY